MYGGFGRGRGGLPRCAYFTGTLASGGSVPGSATMTGEEGLAFLKNRVQAVKNGLEQINSRIRDLESQK